MYDDKENERMTDYQIRPVRPAEYRAVEDLVREAFWNVYRPGAIEHYLIHVLREAEGYDPALDLVVEKDGALIGQSLCMRAEILSDDGRVLPALCLGPIAIAPAWQRQGLGKRLLDETIAIAPAWQRQGLGKRLLDETIARAAALGYGVICLEGNSAFYEKSGFVRGDSLGLRYRDDDGSMAPYFLVRELCAGYLDGVRGVYGPPAAYFVDEAEAEIFDAQFPEKEKMRLPGQLA